MELVGYQQKLKVQKTTEQQSLATEIYEAFGKKISYPLLMKIIKDKGVQFTREIFIETQKSDFAHKKELFLKQTLNQKIIWKAES